jgi:hypothetical protein
MTSLCLSRVGIGASRLAALLLLACVVAAKAQEAGFATSQFAHAKREGDPPESCDDEGNQDLYGLGVRLGRYSGLNSLTHRRLLSMGYFMDRQLLPRRRNSSFA